MKIQFKKNIIATLLVPILAVGCSNDSSPSAGSKNPNKLPVSHDATSKVSPHAFMSSLCVLDPNYAKDTQIESFTALKTLVQEKIKNVSTFSETQIWQLNDRLIAIEPQVTQAGVSQEVKDVFDTLKSFDTEQLNKLVTTKQQKVQDALQAVYTAASIVPKNKETLSTGEDFDKLVTKLQNTHKSDATHKAIDTALKNFREHVAAFTNTASKLTTETCIQPADKAAQIAKFQKAEETLSNNFDEFIDADAELAKIDKLLANAETQFIEFAKSSTDIKCQNGFHGEKGDDLSLLKSLITKIKTSKTDQKTSDKISDGLEHLQASLKPIETPWQQLQRAPNLTKEQEEKKETLKKAYQAYQADLKQLNKAKDAPQNTFDAAAQLTLLTDWHTQQQSYLKQLHEYRAAYAVKTKANFHEDNAKKARANINAKLVPFLLEFAQKNQEFKTKIEANQSALNDKSQPFAALLQNELANYQARDKYYQNAHESISETLKNLCAAQIAANDDEQYFQAQDETLKKFDQLILKQAKALKDFEEQLSGDFEAFKNQQISTVPQKIKDETTLSEIKSALAPKVTLWEDVQEAQKQTADLLAHQLVAARLLSIGSITGNNATLDRVKNLANIPIDERLFDNNHIWRMMTHVGGGQGRGVTTQTAWTGAGAAAGDADADATITSIVNVNAVSNSANPGVLAALFAQVHTNEAHITATTINSAGNRTALTGGGDTYTLPAFAGAGANASADAAAKKLTFDTLAQEARTRAEAQMQAISTEVSKNTTPAAIQHFAYRELEKIAQKIQTAAKTKSALQKPVYGLQDLENPEDETAKFTINSIITLDNGHDYQAAMNAMPRQIQNLAKNLREIHLVAQRSEGFEQPGDINNAVRELYDTLVNNIALSSIEAHNRSVNYFEMYRTFVETQTDIQKKVTETIDGNQLVNNITKQKEQLDDIAFKAERLTP